MLGRIVTSIALIICTGATFAGEQTGQILSLRVSSTTLSSNTTHFLISGSGTNKPACATLQFWAIDSDTTAGRNFLATLLSAQATGRDVIVYGANRCGLRAGMETVAEIDLAP